MSMIRLENLLKSGTSDSLEGIVRRARELGELTVALRAALDPEAAPHLLAANLRDDAELVLICSTPAWAARIRFDSEALLRAAEAAGAAAKRCTVKVRR
jgi:hypothetical protein